MAKDDYLVYFRFKKHKGLWYIVYKTNPGKEVPTGRSVDRYSLNDMIPWAYGRLDKKPTTPVRFGEFTKDFFLPEKCGWSQMMLGTGHTYSSSFFVTHRGRLVKRFIPALRDEIMTSITPEMIADIIINARKTDGDPVGISEKKHMRSCIMKIFNYAVYKKIVRINPVKATPSFVESFLDRHKFEIDEVRKLFPQDRQQLMYIWQSQMWITYNYERYVCGHRPGETSALSWEDWNRELRGFVVKRSFDSRAGELKGLKTEKKGVRKKPAIITTRLERELTLLEAQPGKRVYAEYRGERVPLIFHINEGPVRVETAAKHFKAACKRAGVPLHGRTQYRLRHTFESALLEVLYEHEVQVLMGHANKITAIYDDRSDEAYLRFADDLRPKIERVLDV